MKYNELFAEKYRPQNINDVIVDEDIKKTFNKFIEEEDFPNLILYSKRSGTGKTTLAKALIKELNLESLSINGSIDGNVETLRSKFMDFVKTYSMENKRKVIFIDEGDKLSSAMQDGLRKFMEEYSENVRFIITCNHEERIIEAIQSRCSRIHICSTDKKTKKEALVKVLTIAKAESVSMQPKDILEMFNEKYPDLRNTLTALQTPDVYKVSNKDFDFDILLSGNFDKYSAYIATAIFSKKDAENFYESFKEKTIAGNSSEAQKSKYIIKAHEYLYRLAFVNDPRINVTAFIASL